MDSELENKREAVLKTMVDMEYFPAIPELNLDMKDSAKIPIENLSALGVAFQPLVSAIQTVVGGSGGSGIYFVNTLGKRMHNFNGSHDFLGSLKAVDGTVGGGQARLTQLPCDPTMLFMAAALINIEKKLDAIQETQIEILEFLEEKERATLQGNLNTLNDITSNYKYNWDNEKYKTNKHILVQQIKKEAEASITLYRDQITKKLRKRSLIHSDREVKETLKKLQRQFRDYQLALYLYSYAAFLEVMLLGNFNENYLNAIEKRISDYAFQYRELYTNCYNIMESYIKSSIQAGVWSSLITASKFMESAITKVPAISDTQLEKNLIETSSKLDKHGKMRVKNTLIGFTATRENITIPFVENINMLNRIYNKPAVYSFDNNNIYVYQLEAN